MRVDEHGKGFAVVAEEARNFAHRSAGAGVNGSKPSSGGNGKRSEPAKPVVVDGGEFDDDFEDY
jgi:hypothetical protein